LEFSRLDRDDLESDLVLLLFAKVLFLIVFEAVLDVELTEAIEDVDDEELLDCFRARVFEIDANVFTFGTFGIAKKLEEAFKLIFI